MERAINGEPLFGEDVPPIARSHENISIAADVTGPFANPFAAAAAAEVDAAHAIDDAKKRMQRCHQFPSQKRIKFPLKSGHGANFR